MSNPVGPQPRRVAVHRILLAVLSTQLGIACDGAERDSRVSPHPNVLLVVIDSLRADHLKSYGYERETSPTLDRLAREGARFEIALSPSSWALPSLVTLLTGLPPEQHRVDRVNLALSDDALTLTEVLQDAGFATAAFVAGRDSEPSRGLSQGFDRYQHVLQHTQEGGATGSEAVSWLADWDRNGRTHPFFLFVHLPLETSDGEQSAIALHASGDSDAKRIERAISIYDRRIGQADSQLEVILQKLDQLDLTRETVVVVTASHGEEFLERGNIGHGNTLHGESLRVPLIVRYPRLIDVGKLIAQPARLMDIGTTILMLARVREPIEFGFRFRDDELTRDLTEFLVGEWNGEDVLIGGALAGRSQSIRHGGYKLIKRGDEQIQLFDMTLDPDEKHDLSASESRRTEVYLKKLRTWRGVCAERPQFARAQRKDAQ